MPLGWSPPLRLRHACDGAPHLKDQLICEPSHVMVSPHMEIGVMLGGGKDALEDMKRTHVLGPNAQKERKV